MHPKATNRSAIRVLMVTTEWPSLDKPNQVPFLVRHVEKLRQKSIVIEVFHFQGSRNIFNYARAAIHLMKILSTGSYDLIQAQWGQSAIPVFFTSLPLVITFRGSDLFGIADRNGRHTFMGGVLTLISRLAARRATKVIIVAKRMADFLPRKTKFEVIPSGIDLDLFKPLSQIACRKKLNLPVSGKLIFFGGHPSKYVKRYSLAVSAVDELNKKIDATLFYADNVPISAIPDYMNAADVLLLTSLHEGSPNVVKEALACNLPVVSVRVGDVEERIGRVAGCKVCLTDDPSEIAAAIGEALKFDRLQFKGRDFVLDLDENKTTEKVIQVYQEVIHAN